MAESIDNNFSNRNNLFESIDNMDGIKTRYQSADINPEIFRFKFLIQHDLSGWGYK